MAKTLMQLAQENKQAYINACNAVIGRGGTVPSGMPASELANAITNIPNDQTLAYQKVVGSTSRVIVPQKAEPVAIVNKIGGATYKSKQLLKLRTLNETQDGLTITTNADGSYTLNGTGTGSFMLWQSEEDYPYKAIAQGRTVMIKATGLEQYAAEWCALLWASSNLPEGAEYPELEDNIASGDTYQYSPSSGYWLDFIVLDIGYTQDGSIPTFNNVTFTVMVNEGSTAEPYVPFFEGLRSAKTESIVSEGANLLDISKAVNANFVDNGDGTYTITNNGGVERFSKTFPIFIPANTTVTIKGFRVSGEINCLIQFRFADGTWWEDCPYFDGVARKRTPEKDIISARFFVNSGTANEGKPVTIRDIQIQYGETATEYKPFVGTLGTTTIPEAVTSLEGYGEGVNADYYNYLEWRDGRCYFVQNCKKIVFNGTEGWYVGSLETENQYFALEGYPLNAILNGGIMTDYDATNVYGAPSKKVGWNLYKTDKFLLRMRPANILTDFPTLADWKAHLAERYAQGNPLTFIYALAEPIETDITDLMTVDNAIVVEGGGSIKFVNEYGYDMPNETTYIINTVGG